MKLAVTAAPRDAGAAPLNEAFMALLFSMIRLPDPIATRHQRAQQLRLEVARLESALSSSGNVRFMTNKGLNILAVCPSLARALNRSLFTIGIDNNASGRVQPSFIRVCSAPREALRRV
ncbi:hypothetical protein KCP70_04290 [Salmonella enterica subsp. enterica]|nr:hypothetical protein KCP70_04290 [Salmonella enterica subsp. enterica]